MLSSRVSRSHVPRKPMLSILITRSEEHPTYNFHHLGQCIREIRIQSKGWETYFHNRGIKPYRVVYEDLVEDRERYIRRALNFLKVTIPKNFQDPDTHLRKQADSLSDEWAREISPWRSDVTSKLC